MPNLIRNALVLEGTEDDDAEGEGEEEHHDDDGGGGGRRRRTTTTTTRRMHGHGQVVPKVGGPNGDGSNKTKAADEILGIVGFRDQVIKDEIALDDSDMSNAHCKQDGQG